MVTIHYTTSLIKHKKLKVAKIPSLTLLKICQHRNEHILIANVRV